MENRELLPVIRESYHKIVCSEYEKFLRIGDLSKIYLTYDEITKELGVDHRIIDELVRRGFLVTLDKNTFRSLLMDAAFRISDVRIQYGGTKYVLESNLRLISRPFLNWNYIRFDQPNRDLERFKNALKTIIPSDIVESFIQGLKHSGLEGLSRYQYLSILRLLEQRKDAVISAPTAFGKTYIFLIPVLLTALRAKIEGKRGTVAVIFYPRKSLGSDQMARLIKLIYHLNEICRVNITIGIDDGDVKRRKDIIDGEKFRGIRCPIHSKQHLLIKNKKIFCPECNRTFDFIRFAREDFEQDPPSILITNIWAYQYRLSEPIYWKNGYLSPTIEYLIFDEIHAYRSIVAGVLRYFINLLRSLVSEKASVILSSATIPKLQEFICDLTGKDLDKFSFLVYDENLHGKDIEKLELYLLLGINPLTSWETFIHELAIFLSTVNRLRRTGNFQSLVFVDSIRNISRLYTQTMEAVKLGDPKDHLLSTVPPEDPFCYWIYNTEYKVNYLPNEKVDLLREEIINNIETHYSDKADRFEVEERIRSGDVDVVFTTSTLELGVDYDRVSVIVNAGIPFALESIVQRIGRAGRNEERTLFTSLCVIIVRNNPLEYFYMYKGIEDLIDINALPKIPVAYLNVFVAFYSILIYALAYLAKSGTSLVGKEPLIILETLSKYLDEFKDRAVKELNIPLDISDMQKRLNILVQSLKDPRVHEKIELLKLDREKTWLLRELEILIHEFNKTLEDICGKIDELNKQEKLLFQKEIEYLKKCLEEWKKLDLSNIQRNFHTVIESIDNLKNRIRWGAHPLYQFRKDLAEYSFKLECFEPKISSILDIETEKLSDEEQSIYLKADEILKIQMSSPIRIIETIIGFKFMGNEFIDQVVFTGAEFHLPVQKKEQFLNDVIMRMPPFELITIPFESREERDVTKVVGARHFWLIKPLRGFYIISLDTQERPKEITQLLQMMEETKLGKGYTDKLKDMIIPSEINFIDLLTLRYPIIVRMMARDGKPLFIKYGSKIITSSKIDGKYPVYDNIRRLYSLEPSHELFGVIKRRTLEFLRRLDNDLQRSGNEWGINFRYPFLCLQGRCISTDPFDKVCPVSSYCDFPRCEGKKFWTGTIRKRRIFPKFHINLKVRNIPKLEEPLLFRVGTITYDHLKEEIEFVFNSATVYLPIRFSDYMLREVELSPLGYCAKTSLIFLSFNKMFIEKLLDLMIEDKELINLLKFKFFMFEMYKKLSSSLDAALQYEKYDQNKIDVKSEEFKSFLRRCLIHTLAHLFFIFLVSKKVNVDPERITYFVDDSNIYILENSKNDGMGFVETIKNEIRDRGEQLFLKEFFDWSFNFISSHEKQMQKHQEILKEDSALSLKKIKDLEIAENIGKLKEKIKKLNEKIGLYVDLDYVDVITYRHILSCELREWEEFEDKLSEYIMPLVHGEGIPKLCVDGCDECLIFYRGCADSFAQNYTISKLLVYKFLEIIKKGHLSIVGKGMGELIRNFMKFAEHITIKVPFIDDYGFNILLEEHKKGKRIEVITRADNVFVFHLLASGIPVKTEEFHSKIYLFKKGLEEILIHGSVNLIRSSLIEKEENLVLIWDPLELSMMKKEIEEEK
ncbi:MAG: DEAD/DEAH box helicase [Candidatus Methanomethylicia archaeon]